MAHMVVVDGLDELGSVVIEDSHHAARYKTIVMYDYRMHVKNASSLDEANIRLYTELGSAKACLDVYK